MISGCPFKHNSKLWIICSLVKQYCSQCWFDRSNAFLKWKQRNWSKLFLLRTDFQGSYITPWVVQLLDEALWEKIEVMDVGSTYWALEEKICGILKSSFSTSKYHISTNCMGFWTTFLSFESKFIKIDRSIGILVFFPPGSEHIQTISWRLEIKRRSHLKVERPKASSQLLARYQERKDRETSRTFARPTISMT